MNARLAGVTDSAGGVGGSTVSVTGIVFGEPVAPAAVTVTSVVYVPGGQAGDRRRDRDRARVRPARGRHAQPEARSSEAVQSIDPPPVLATASVFAAGLDAALRSPLNDRLAGVTESAGGVGRIDREASPGSSWASRRRPSR